MVFLLMVQNGLCFCVAYSVNRGIRQHPLTKMKKNQEKLQLIDSIRNKTDRRAQWVGSQAYISMDNQQGTLIKIVVMKIIAGVRSFTGVKAMIQ